MFCPPMVKKAVEGHVGVMSMHWRERTLELRRSNMRWKEHERDLSIPHFFGLRAIYRWEVPLAAN